MKETKIYCDFCHGEIPQGCHHTLFFFIDENPNDYLDSAAYIPEPATRDICSTCIEIHFSSKETKPCS